MKSRLEDLIATADRQLASNSYDAAIDTYRTALGEAGAVEAGVESRLQAACRARDEARGVVGLTAPLTAETGEPPLARQLEPVPREPGTGPFEAPSFRLPLVTGKPSASRQLEPAPREPDTGPNEAPSLRPKAETVEPPPARQLDPEPPAPAAPVLESPALEPPALEPPPPEPDTRFIEAPSFHLLEDDPSMLERPRRREYIDEPPLSIHDPGPRPEVPDQARRRLGALGILLTASGVLVSTVSHKSHVARFSPPAMVPADDRAYPVGHGVTSPTLISSVEPEYTEAARQDKIEGTVVLFVEVDQTGGATVRGILQSLDPGLDQRAIEAVNQWRYQPGTRGGVPVRVSERVEVNFRLP